MYFHFLTLNKQLIGRKRKQTQIYPVQHKNINRRKIINVTDGNCITKYVVATSSLHTKIIIINQVIFQCFHFNQSSVNMSNNSSVTSSNIITTIVKHIHVTKETNYILLPQPFDYTCNVLKYIMQQNSVYERLFILSSLQKDCAILRKSTLIIWQNLTYPLDWYTTNNNLNLMLKWVHF